jgi:hypothetical protein
VVETRRRGPEHGAANEVSVVASRGVENRRSPLFARVVAWLIVPVYIAGTGANIWLEGRLRPNEGNLWEDALLLVGFGAFAVVGALLVAKSLATLSVGSWPLPGSWLAFSLRATPTPLT